MTKSHLASLLLVAASAVAATVCGAFWVPGGLNAVIHDRQLLATAIVCLLLLGMTLGATILAFTESQRRSAAWRMRAGTPPGAHKAHAAPAE